VVNYTGVSRLAGKRALLTLFGNGTTTVWVELHAHRAPLDEVLAPIRQAVLWF